MTLADVVAAVVEKFPQLFCSTINLFRLLANEVLGDSSPFQRSLSMIVLSVFPCSYLMLIPQESTIHRGDT